MVYILYNTVKCLFPAYKPKFAEPKKKNSDSESRYLRDDYRDSRDRDRDRYSRSGAPGGYPYGDRDRDRDRGSVKRIWENVLIMFLSLVYYFLGVKETLTLLKKLNIF